MGSWTGAPVTSLLGDWWRGVYATSFQVFLEVVILSFHLRMSLIHILCLNYFSQLHQLSCFCIAKFWKILEYLLNACFLSPPYSCQPCLTVSCSSWGWWIFCDILKPVINWIISIYKFSIHYLLYFLFCVFELVLLILIDDGDWFHILIIIFKLDCIFQKFIHRIHLFLLALMRGWIFLSGNYCWNQLGYYQFCVW